MCLIIFFFSHQPGAESTKISSNFIIRKLGHFSEYALLGFFSFNYLTNIFIQRVNIEMLRVTSLISLLFAVFYAISDEFHQTFVVGRDGNFKDVLIDSTGAFFGIIIANIFFYYIFSQKK